MSLEDILQELDEQCRLECQEIFARAQEEMKKILDKADEEAQATRKVRLDRVKAEAESEVTSLLYASRLRSRNAVIEAKDRISEQALQQAEEKLSKMRSRDDYPSILEGYLAEALERFDAEVIVRVDPRDEELAEKLLREQGRKYDLRTDIETSGGAIVSDVEEKVIIINTVEERLNRARERLRMEVHDILFGEEEKAATGGG